jgi:hypothetical protein
LSPRELYREFAAENARRRNQANRDARLAHLAVSMWATATTKHRVPALQTYLIAADPAPAPQAAKVAKMRSALSVLSAQYGIPLRPLVKEGHHDG